MSDKPPIEIPVCSECKRSEHLSLDASAGWNPVSLCWDYINTYDDAFCGYCEGETSTDNVIGVPCGSCGGHYSPEEILEHLGECVSENK